MVRCIKMNPSYVCWGPYEDYMGYNGTAWSSPLFYGSWRSFGPWELDEFNEIVNFYFEIERSSVNCESCGNSGLNVEARANKLGFNGHCDKCGGRGFIYIEETAHLNLILWMLHPRKGCSRGIEIKNITESDLSEVRRLLLEAQSRNNERFSKISASDHFPGWAND